MLKSMKKYLFLFLTCFSLQVGAFSQQDLLHLLQKPQSIEGEFVQQRFLKSLTKPIQSQGDFVLVSKKGLLWQMKKPFTLNLRVTPKGIMQWNGEQWLAANKMGQDEQISLFLGLLGGDIQGLSSQFDIQLSGTERDWQLTLVPNNLLMKQIFNQIIMRGDKLVNQIELNETQGDRTIILLSQLKTNTMLSDFARSALE